MPGLEKAAEPWHQGHDGGIYGGPARYSALVFGGCCGGADRENHPSDTRIRKEFEAPMRGFERAPITLLWESVVAG